MKNVKIAKALKQAAAESQMSDVAIAALVGVGQQSVRNWLNGKSEPRFDNLVELIKEVPHFGSLIGLRLAA